MDIIAHRGFWLNKEEQNTEIAFKRALTNGFGIETDLRDESKSIVISHDIPPGNCMSFSSFLDLSKIAPHATLALNIKADGLQHCLSLSEPVNPHFYFDMSAPDMLGYLHRGMPVYTRYSDIENQPTLIEKCRGVWLDNFKDGELNVDALRKFLRLGKNVVLVSPELHKRNMSTYWSVLKEFLDNNISYKSSVGMCTDYPLDARNFFNGQ